MEISLLLNLVTFIVYWGVIHCKVIDHFTGWQLFPMYPVHIFPTLAYFMNAKVTRFELCADHWKLFIPLGILYCIINYFET